MVPSSNPRVLFRYLVGIHKAFLFTLSHTHLEKVPSVNWRTGKSPPLATHLNSYQRNDHFSVQCFLGIEYVTDSQTKQICALHAYMIQ